MATIEELEQAVRRAHQSGDIDSVRRIGRELRALQRGEAASAAVDSTGRTLGLAGRAAVEGTALGVLGLPALAYDGTVGTLENLARHGYNLGVDAYNYALDGDAQRVSYRDPFQTSNAVLELGQMGADALELPRPESGGERLASEAVRGGISALTGAGTARLLSAGAHHLPTLAQRTLSTLSSYPATQTSAGTAAGYFGERSAQYANEAGYGPGAQTGARMVGSVVGGLGGAVVPGVARGTLQTLDELRQPLTSAGQQRVAGTVLRDLATDPDEAARTMALSREIVPGSRPTVAEVSRDPGLISNQNAVRSAFDQQGLFAQRESANNLARRAALDGIAPDAPTLQSMRAQLRADTDDLLQRNLWPSSVQVNPASVARIDAQVRQILDSPAGQRPEVRRAMSEVLRGMRRLGSRKTEPEYLYSYRKTLATLRDGVFDNPGSPPMRLARGELDGVIRTLDNVIEEGAPGFKRYLDNYARRAAEIDAMERIDTVRSRSVSSIPDPIAQVDFLAGPAFRREVRKLAQDRGVQLTATQQRVLDEISTDLGNAGATRSNPVRVAGSDTARNISSMGYVMRRILGGGADDPTLRGLLSPTLERPLEFLYRMPSEQIQALVVDAFLDPRFAAQLMQRASPRRVESIIYQLYDRARVGTARGLVEGVTRDAFPVQLEPSGQRERQ